MNLLQILIGYGSLVAPQVYHDLGNYSAGHPGSFVSLILSIIGGVLLHKATPGK